MHRREFLTTGLFASSAAFGESSAFSAFSSATSPAPRVRLSYAPHIGMFRNSAGDDPLDQIRFMADEGFAALEDIGLVSKPVDVQRQLSRTLERHNVQMGVFTAFADFGRATFSSGRPECRARVLAEMHAAARTARRMNARWCSIVPGKLDPRLPMRQQTANAIETLKYCVDICEPAGLTMLIEPLNHWSRHPRLFLHSMSQAFEICRAVGSPHCKLLFDIYQQHTSTGGDVVAQLERLWPEIGYLQFGDSPGRKEPGTGDIDFRRIVSLLRARNYEGVIGMEHGNSLPGQAGERAVIEAYARLERC